MKLYYAPGACSLADHIVLAWTGRPYAAVAVDAKERATPEYRAMNPAGAVPVLVDGEWALTQNVAILTYLADAHPQAGLIGDGSPRSRAEVMRWLAFCNADIHPQYHPLFHGTPYLHDDAASERARTHALEVLAGLYARVDGQLGKHPWLAGQARSVADAYLYVVTRWAKKSGVAIAGLAHLLAHAQRMEADPAVQRVLAEEGLKAVFGDVAA